MSWLQSLRGKTALVTGSTSGIGHGIITQFAKIGCRVMLHGLEAESEITSLKDQLASYSKEKVSYSNANLTDPAACKSLIEKATKELGKVDILVNNAGVQHTAPVQDFPPEKWDWLVAVNLNAPYYLTRAVIPQMYERNWGRLIHIASAHGKVASKNKTAYCATKHGIVGFSRSVALEAAGTGVTSNAICPGWVLTPLVKKQIERISKDKGISFDEAKMELLLEKQPSGEFVNPEDLGAFAVFISSDATSQLTGATLSMDGGWTVAKHIRITLLTCLCDSECSTASKRNLCLKILQTWSGLPSGNNSQMERVLKDKSAATSSTNPSTATTEQGARAFQILWPLTHWVDKRSILLIDGIIDKALFHELGFKNIQQCGADGGANSSGGGARTATNMNVRNQ